MKTSKTQVRALASIRLMLVIAERGDFLDDGGNLRTGTMYFLRSQITGKFDGHPYYFDDFTDREEFKRLFAAKMIYVPLNPTEPVYVQQEIKEVNFLLQKGAS